MRKLAVATAVATIAFSACKKAAPEDPEVELAFRTASDAQGVIEQALTAAQNRNPNRDAEPALAACSRIEPLLPRLNASEHASLANRLGWICRRDLPLAELAAAAADVEADSQRCAVVLFSVRHAGHILMKSNSYDDEARQLADRVGARCPESTR